VITVNKNAKEFLQGVECPEGAVLRLDSVNEHVPGELRVRLAPGEPRGDDQVVEHEGEILLRIGRTLSEELNGGSVALVETAEGLVLGVKTPLPTAGLLLTDGS
jgi:iron-sulfur cluster assembly protein